MAIDNRRNICNKFSRISRPINPFRWPSLPNGLIHPLLSGRIAPMQALIAGGAIPLDNIIAWYFNDEDQNDIIYNMAPYLGLLGGGLLPNFIVDPFLEYWNGLGFGVLKDNSIPSNIILTCDFTQRPIENYSFGIFHKFNNYYPVETFFNNIILFDWSGDESQIYFFIETLTGSFNVTLANLINVRIINHSSLDWCFYFYDSDGIGKIALSDGSLLTLEGDELINPDLMDAFNIGINNGNVDDPLITSFSLLGDIIITNNLQYSQDQWGLIYDFCRSRYGMAERTW